MRYPQIIPILSAENGDNFGLLDIEKSGKTEILAFFNQFYWLK
jgi:hypothetical protein